MRSAMKELCLAVGIAMYLLAAPALSGVEEGEAVFSKRCQTCHKLPDPNKPPKDGWAKRLDQMAPMAGLKKEQKQSVLEFLLYHSKDKEKDAALAEDRAFFENKCSYCHALDRVFLMPLSEENRRHVVERMQNRAGPDWLSDADAERILAYLAKITPKMQEPERLDGKDGHEIMKARCTACHSLERIFLELDENADDPELWTHVVSRMRSKAPQWISETEAQSVIEYLKTLEPQGK